MDALRGLVHDGKVDTVVTEEDWSKGGGVAVTVEGERGEGTIDEDGESVEQEIKENDGRTLSIALSEDKGRTGQIAGAEGG